MDYLIGVIGPGIVSDMVVMITGDAHMLAYDDGSNAPGGIRVCHAAPLGNGNSQKGGPYSGGKVVSSNYQYGVLTFTDANGVLACEFTGYRADTDVATIQSGTFEIGRAAWRERGDASGEDE